VTETVVDAADLGLDRAKPGDLRGGDAAFNADVARRLFAGERGPVRDAVLVNAAAALTARAGTDAARAGAERTGAGAERADADLVGELRAGLDRAAAAVDSGAAGQLLDRWVAVATEAHAAADA
jgi:anthranilate phosphoribosyltransferase